MRERGLLKQLWFWVIVAIGADRLRPCGAGPAEKAKWLADAFIQLIKAVTGPGDLPHGRDRHRVARQPRARGRARAARAGYFFSMTVIALALGLLAANIFAPGSGFNGEPSASAQEAAKESIAEAGDTAPGLVGFITDDLLPTSFVAPFVENEILRVLVLAILVAASISMLPSAAQGDRRRLRDHLAVVFGIIRLIMWVAPLGAFGGMAYTVAVFGADSLTSAGRADGRLLGHVRVLRVRRARHGRAGGGFSIFKLIRLIKDELLIIVGTSSSETVLPRLLAKLQAAGASRQVVGMVLPTGYSFNLDGTCIYLTLGALFIVQASGQDMPIGQQIALAGLMMLTSKGAAGITGAGLVTLTASLQAFGGTSSPPSRSPSASRWSSASTAS